MYVHIWLKNSYVFCHIVSSEYVKLQGFRREDCGNWVPWTSGKHSAGHSRWSPFDVHIRRCFEAEGAESKNNVYTRLSAAEWSVHTFQQEWLSTSTFYTKCCLSPAVMLCLVDYCWYLHCALAAAQCIVIGPVCGCVCGSVTIINQNCMHRSSPNWVCR